MHSAGYDSEEAPEFRSPNGLDLDSSDDEVSAVIFADPQGFC